MRLARAAVLSVISCWVWFASAPALAQGAGSLVVTITSPPSGSTVSGSITINAQYAFESFRWMPLSASEAPTAESAIGFLTFIRTCDNQPPHIVGGARDGRATLVALLRYALDGWTLEDALGEGQRLNGDAPLSPAQVTWLQGWAASHPPGSEQLGSCSGL